MSGQRQCPDCHRGVRAGVKVCSCGCTLPGSAPDPMAGIDIPRAQAQCMVTPDCPNAAKIRRRMPSGKLLPCCLPCDVHATQCESTAALEARGLGRLEGESPECYRRRLLEHYRRTGGVNAVGKKTPAPRQREPGEDEDYSPAGHSLAQGVNEAFT